MANITGITKEDIAYVHKAMQEAKVPTPIDPDYGALMWSPTYHDLVFPIDLTEEDREWWKETYGLAKKQ